MLHRNLEWKLAALILAVCLWAYVTVTANVTEKTFRTEIAPAAIPPGLALTSPLGEATVKLRGTYEALETAGTQVFSKAYPINPHAGRVLARVEPVHPPDLTLVKVTPAEIALELERLVSKSFPITCEFQGEPSPGYILGEPDTSPDSAQVSGAENAVAQVNRVVVRVDTSYAVLGQPQSGLLAAVDAAGRKVNGLEIEPQTAIVVVPVQHSIASKLLPVHVTFSGSVKEGYRVEQVTINPPLVTVAGDAATVKTMRSVSTMPLSLRNVSSSFSRWLQLVVPEGAASLSDKSVLVSVRVSATARPEPPAEPETDAAAQEPQAE